MRRPLVIALVLSLVAAVGAGVWFALVVPGQQLRAAADRVAASFASGTVDDADFTEPAAERLTRAYAGMGALRPTVRVLEVAAGPDGAMNARLGWSWVIHEGKPSWDYETSIPLVRPDGGDYRAVYTPSAVAPGLGPDEGLRATRLTPVRGAIVGQEGLALASNTAALRVGIDKTTTDVATAVASARRLAELFGLDADRFAERVEKAGPRAFLEARVLRAHDPAEADLAERATQWIGVRALPTTYPLGRTSSFARPLLGVVGEASAEQVEKSGGTIRAGDLAGRGGLQEARNHVLAGTTGFEVSIVDAAGAAREAFRVDELPGNDVRTTIDVALQARAEALLAGVGPASALVAIRPSDGAILAAASGPGSNGLSTATLGQYAPGSTFKAVTTLAMLRHGASADTPVECTDGVTVSGFRFDNWQGYPASALGPVPLHTALAHSCNSAFINARADVTQADLAAAATSLGLTAEPQLVVGGFLGRVPESSESDVDHAASMIGQARVLASPLGMATVAASIAGGHTVTPVLVPEPGRTPASPPVPLTADEAGALRALLTNVVDEGGYAALRGVGGEPILAKTGTATFGTGEVRYHGWMIAAQGDLAVAAFVEDASSGASDAGPLVAGLLAARD